MLNPASYRKFVSLGGHHLLMLRFLNGQDRQGFLKLFQEASQEKTHFLNHGIRDLQGVNQWLDHLDYRKVLPLVAVDLKANRLVASAHLHLWGKRAPKHIDEISVYISKSFRNLGLDTIMLNEIISLALNVNLLGK